MQDISVVNGYAGENVKVGGSIPFLINMHEAFLVLHSLKQQNRFVWHAHLKSFSIP
jgi:hypothetical protein